jgi:hypothetical protein
MTFVWSAVCALAALAAGVQQTPGAEEGSQMRTKVLPGHGYIRYEVMPGDDETPPGDLIVVHEERSYSRRGRRGRAGAACGYASRGPAHDAAGKLVARLAKFRDADQAEAEWLERNITLGSDARGGQLLYGEPLLVSALRSDGVARDLADDLARCEKAHAR